MKLHPGMLTIWPLYTITFSLYAVGVSRIKSLSYDTHGNRFYIRESDDITISHDQTTIQ